MLRHFPAKRSAKIGDLDVIRLPAGSASQYRDWTKLREAFLFEQRFVEDGDLCDPDFCKRI